jgi:hypothetical protein
MAGDQPDREDGVPDPDGNAALVTVTYAEKGSRTAL